jgi:hypothetical protein
MNSSWIQTIQTQRCRTRVLMYIEFIPNKTDDISAVKPSNSRTRPTMQDVNLPRGWTAARALCSCSLSMSCILFRPGRPQAQNRYDVESHRFTLGYFTPLGVEDWADPFG